ncbi:MAG: hypothetical protein HWE20_04950 [Gammaproteobacteria bacterium]|nr:hypothetical protein [Gammaproteobacteria bacterium]
MNILTREDLRAAAFASFVAGPAFWFSRYMFEPKAIFNEEWWAAFVGPVFWQAFTYPVSIAGIVLLGMPCHAFLRYVGINSYVFIGLLGAPLVVCVNEFLFSDGAYDQITLQFIFCGASVSAFYAALSKKFNKLKVPTR